MTAMTTSNSMSVNSMSVNPVQEFVRRLGRALVRGPGRRESNGVNYLDRPGSQYPITPPTATSAQLSAWPSYLPERMTNNPPATTASVTTVRMTLAWSCHHGALPHRIRDGWGLLVSRMGALRLLGALTLKEP